MSFHHCFNTVMKKIPIGALKNILFELPFHVKTEAEAELRFMSLREHSYQG